jgi:hypothetical protein
VAKEFFPKATTIVKGNHCSQRKINLQWDQLLVLEEMLRALLGKQGKQMDTKLYMELDLELNMKQIDLHLLKLNLDLEQQMGGMLPLELELMAEMIPLLQVLQWVQLQNIPPPSLLSQLDMEIC